MSKLLNLSAAASENHRLFNNAPSAASITSKTKLFEKALLQKKTAEQAELARHVKSVRERVKAEKQQLLNSSRQDAVPSNRRTPRNQSARSTAAAANGGNNNGGPGNGALKNRDFPQTTNVEDAAETSSVISANNNGGFNISHIDFLRRHVQQEERRLQDEKM